METLNQLKTTDPAQHRKDDGVALVVLWIPRTFGGECVGIRTSAALLVLPPAAVSVSDILYPTPGGNVPLNRKRQKLWQKRAYGSPRCT